MIWRNNIVVKLALTIVILVIFVLSILFILLMQFFENFFVGEAEAEMLETANELALIINQHESRYFIQETTELIKDPNSRVTIIYPDDDYWLSTTTDPELIDIEVSWLENEIDLSKVLTSDAQVEKLLEFPEQDTEVMIVGTSLYDSGGVFIYQSLDVIDQLKTETRQILLLSVGFAIVLTVFFAVFLSTRITSPLIKMREAAAELTKGEFNTKVPVLTHDELGELANEFNRMGRQLKFHINALNQEKEQLESIVSSMADGVITLNRNEDIIVINPPAEKHLDDWYYEHKLVDVADRPKIPYDIRDALQEVIQTEKRALREFNLQGRSFVMLMTPLYDRSYVRGAVAVIRDMTEERQLDKLRKDFIANVSHELRTPIAMLQGYSEAIVDDIAETKEEKNELAAIIHDESLRLSRLVNELLDLARMEAGHIQLKTEEVEIAPYIERIMNKFSGLASENKVELKLTMENTVEVSTFDQDRIEQVFTNLIDNGIRHTNENGYVHLNIKTDEDHFKVIISDNGSGIAEEDLAFVFERFYKADKARTRNKEKKGTGLGLAIAKNIVDAHQGTINVKSILEQGTTFTFTIPNQKEIS